MPSSKDPHERINYGLAIFWATHVPIAIAAYLLLGFEAFVKASLLYTVLASIWANVASHYAGALAAKLNR